MEQVTKKGFMVFLLLSAVAVGFSSAQESQPGAPPPNTGAQNPWATQLEPVLRFFDYFAHLESPDILRRVFADFSTWYRQQLASQGQSNGLSSLLNLGSLDSLINGQNQWNPFGMAESSGADDIEAGLRDLLKEIDTSELDMHIQKLVDSLLPRPNPVEAPSSTQKPVVEVDHNSVGRRFHAAPKPANVPVQTA